MRGTTFTGFLGDSVCTRERALRVVEDSIERLDGARGDLAVAYATAESGTDEEFEMGECLTQVRKALARLRKAKGLLAQMTLPRDQKDDGGL